MKKHACEYKNDGETPCGGEAAYRLLITVKDRGPKKPSEHYYCSFHGPIAKDHVDLAARSVGRSKVVTTVLEPSHPVKDEVTK